MLRIIQNVHAAGAKSYYSTADYYSEGQELEGRWRGLAAERLGLDGTVAKNQWEALCDNLHPITGKSLTPRNNSDRTVGYDFNFHVPKSVSLLYAMTRDERLLEAFRDAVDGTMQDMEAEMQSRVRKNGKNENRVTGNMVWGEFIHFTARPVGGVPDPHLHAHCFVFNTTWDEPEKTFKAGQFRELKRDAPYFEAVFHSRLAYRLNELGLPIERTAKGWELGSVGKTTLTKFSRRTAQIEDLAREKGIEDIEAKSELGAKTRNRKQKDMSFSELQDDWRSRLTDTELDALKNLEHRVGGDTEPTDSSQAAKALEYATLHSFERQSVLPERKLLTVALKQGVGKATVEQVLDIAKTLPLIRGDIQGRAMVSTPEVFAEERQVIEFARKGRGACKPLQPDHYNFHRDWLGDQQKAAVRHVLSSRDRMIVLRGAAGVGKTTLMQEAVEAIEQGGTKVLAFAPSADASRGILRDAGFENADTVAKLLLDQNLQTEAAGQVIWIDEAGLLGSKTLAKVVALAERIDARLLLSGDRKQHASVERGSPLALLEREAGIVPVEIKEIKRQQGEYKTAVRLLSEQKTAEGFDHLNRLGWIKEISYEERYRQMAVDYTDTIESGKSALVVSPTHVEGRRITAEIRAKLTELGLVANEEHSLTVLENAGLTEAERSDSVNYELNDVVIFHQNAKGHKRGDRIEFRSSSVVPFEQASRFQVFHSSEKNFAAGDRIRITANGSTKDGKHRLNNGSFYTIKSFTPSGDIILKENNWLIDRDYGHLTHGYVVTSHASQGKSVDRVFIGQSHESFPASSREQFYVSVSRGQKQATIYTDDKNALRQAISESEDRMTATDLVNQHRGQIYLDQHPQIMREQVREGIAYDR